MRAELGTLGGMLPHRVSSALRLKWCELARKPILPLLGYALYDSFPLARGQQGSYLIEPVYRVVTLGGPRFAARCTYMRGVETC